MNWLNLGTAGAILLLAGMTGGAVVRAGGLIGNRAALLTLGFLAGVVVVTSVLGSRYRQNARTPYW